MSQPSARPVLCAVRPAAEAGRHAARDRVESLLQLARGAGWQVRQTRIGDQEEMDGAVAMVLLDGAGAAGARRQFPNALLVSPESGDGADLSMADDVPESALSQMLRHAENHWRLNLKVLELFRDVGARRQRTKQLSDIGRVISLKMDFGELLETILFEARRLAGCEAGSLYLIDRSAGEPALAFKLAQNDAAAVPFVEQRLPLTNESLAGHVALTGAELDIPDVYELPENAPYRFNRAFDQQAGYRTQSVLVLPMRDHRNEIVGVLQFINRLDAASGRPVAFGEELAELLKAVASQAAVSIQKNQLLIDIRQLFESFVLASVKAIEQRDPSTSGHSFRVAETTVALLESLPVSGFSRFRSMSFSDEHLREVRYAALLHDFGKVGVRENVLLKANKLTDARLEILRYRFELQKERLRRRALERELELLHHAPVDVEVARRRVHRQLEGELAVLDEYYGLLVRANQPNVIDSGDFEHLREIREYGFRELDGSPGSLISAGDLSALSVRRGSLTPEERLEIQSHVSHTREFLSVLPWPPELAQVPEIAGAHHEKLDGSGYPLGLVGEEIPLASRVMAVCDIYDALTAMDRPYKRAMPVETALGILEDEAGQGLLDHDIVRVFIESRTFELGAGRSVGRAS